MPLSKISNPFFSNNVTANVYSPSANTVAIKTAGDDRVNIDSVGRVLIGANTIIAGTSNAHLQITQNTIAGLSIATRTPIAATGSIAGIDGYCFDGANTTVAATINIRATETWNVTNHGSAIQFRTTPTGSGQSLAEAGRISSTGNYVLKGGTLEPGGVGIAFPSSQAASSDPNTLDDYEEGTWTPVLYGGSVAGTFTPGVSNGGWYTKIGKVVIAAFNANGTMSNSPSGIARVSGLPFTNTSSNPGNSGYSTGALQYAAGSAANWMGPLVTPGTTTMYFHTYDGNSAGTSTIGNGFYNIHCFVIYSV